MPTRGTVASFDDPAGYRRMAAQAGAAVRGFRVRHRFADGDLVCSVVEHPGNGIRERRADGGGGPGETSSRIVRDELINAAEELRKAMSRL